MTVTLDLKETSIKKLTAGEKEADAQMEKTKEEYRWLRNSVFHEQKIQKSCQDSNNKK